MSDEIDRIQDAAEIQLTAALSHISAAIPAGEPGECAECGEIMPRLVGGRCGYCRDGRRPPLSRYPDLPARVAEARRDAPVVPAATVPAIGASSEEENRMQMPAVESRKVTIEGAALDAVDARANAGDISFKQAASELIELGAAREAIEVASADIVAADVADLSDADLLAELASRLDGDPAALSSAVARAEAAEASLAAVRQALASIGQ